MQSKNGDNETSVRIKRTPKEPCSGIRTQNRDAVLFVIPNTIHRKLNDASYYMNNIEVIRIPIKS